MLKIGMAKIKNPLLYSVNLFLIYIMLFPLGCNNSKMPAGDPTGEPIDDKCSSLFVNPNAKVGGNGSSWQKAFNSIQAAIDAEKASSSPIIVAQGTFIAQKNEPLIIIRKNNLTIKGGYKVGQKCEEERDKNEMTTLDGNNKANQIINIDKPSVSSLEKITIDGFNLKNGKAATSFPASLGSGIFARGVNGLVVENCSFEDNDSGLGIQQVSSFKLSSSKFSNNRERAVQIWSSPSFIITTTEFADNNGAIKLFESKHGKISHSIFKNNRAKDIEITKESLPLSGCCNDITDSRNIHLALGDGTDLFNMLTKKVD